MSKGKLRNAVLISHMIIENIVAPGDIVVDATCGHGKDTVFLANLVGEQGKVYAFDIQLQAINSTLSRLKEAHLDKQVKIIHDSHTKLDEYISGDTPIKACMFNLGYLPGSSNQDIITTGESTIAAIKSALNLLENGGIITLVSYPGHPGGKEELNLVQAYLKRIPQHVAEICEIKFLNQVNNPPLIITLEKLVGGKI